MRRIAAITFALACACAGEPELRTTRFAVTGMVCASCEEAICARVSKLEGVSGCTADHVGSAAEVQHDPARAPAEAIAALPLIEVPAVTGKYLNKAKTLLKDSGLDAGDIKRVEHEEHGENYVLRQDPAAGAKVPFGTTITLTVVAPN